MPLQDDLYMRQRKSSFFPHISEFFTAIILGEAKCFKWRQLPSEIAQPLTAWPHFALMMKSPPRSADKTIFIGVKFPGVSLDTVRS